MMHGKPLNCSADFLGNITRALENNISVEFLYELNDKYSCDTGELQDILISPRIANIDTFIFTISYIDKKTREQKYYVSPPMYDDTMEYNETNMDKYYLKTLSSKSKDPRNRITIFN